MLRSFRKLFSRNVGAAAQKEYKGITVAYVGDCRNPVAFDLMR